jgi:hypothetical protein
MKKAAWMFQLHGDTRGIPRKLAEGITTSIFPGQQVMLSVVRVEPNSTGTVHSHPEEQWGVVLEGRCTRIQAGEEAEAKVGVWYALWHAFARWAHHRYYAGYEGGQMAPHTIRLRAGAFDFLRAPPGI